MNLVNMHLILGHVVADHSFTNNYKIRTYKGWNLIGHMLWSAFAILAFTFDILLKSPKGIAILLTFILIHWVGDWLRTKFYEKGQKRKIDILEATMLVIAIIFNALVASDFSKSYLSAEFVYYLMGMSIVSVGVTYIFRNFYPGKEDLPDIDGISERLAVFVFTLANRPLFAALSLAIAYLYRLFRYKKPDPTWWMSPVLGVGISLLWYVTMH